MGLGGTCVSSGLQNVRALIFDLDGTLYRMDPMRRRMLGRLCLAVMRNPTDGIRTLRLLKSYRHAQEVLRSAPRPETSLDQAQLRLASEMSRSTMEEVSQAVTRWMEEEPLDLLRRWPRRGMLALLEETRRRGIPMAVVSDYPARPKLKALELEGYFDHVISAQDADVQAFKPHPRGLEMALQRLRVRASDAIYVGDRPEVDGVCAERAGTRCVIVGAEASAGYPQGWIFARDFQNLPALLWPAAGRQVPVKEGMRIA